MSQKKPRCSFPGQDKRSEIKFYQMSSKFPNKKVLSKHRKESILLSDHNQLYFQFPTDSPVSNKNLAMSSRYTSAVFLILSLKKHCHYSLNDPRTTKIPKTIKDDVVENYAKNETKYNN